jgi:hypothetical protein
LGEARATRIKFLVALFTLDSKGKKTMPKLFDDLMTGLDEVEAFLAGKTTGCRVTHTQ